MCYRLLRIADERSLEAERGSASILETAMDIFISNVSVVAVAKGLASIRIFQAVLTSAVPGMSGRLAVGGGRSEMWQTEDGYGGECGSPCKGRKHQ
jgi:hypothetical protein